jgi:methylenetetrahydrofolate dehydrogenase (NADP+) / methenyltetrahydrofolate cyclohydrolase
LLKMTAQWLDGRALATRLRQDLHEEALQFIARQGRAAHLEIVAVGDEPSAHVFSQQVARSCHRIGVTLTRTDFPAEEHEDVVREHVTRANADPSIDGVVILFPLPVTIRQRVITEGLAPLKDVDGLGPANAGQLLLGYPSYVPGTAEAILTLLHHAQIPIRGKHAVVVGRSTVGGKPVALQLLRHDATVTICHSHTQDLAAITRTADILVASIGHPGSITGDMVQKGAIVFDAGSNITDAGIVGDVDAASVLPVAGWLTPVPGGLGPLTHLMVIRHTLLGRN